MEIFIIIIITFLLRLIPKLNFMSSISYDAYFHLYLKNEIRNQGKVPRKFDRISLNNDLTYPFAYHKILSFIPQKYDLIIDSLSSAILDSLYVFIIYFFAYNISNDQNIAIYSALLIAFSTSFLRISNAPRAYNITPRVFGELLILLHFISIILFSLNYGYVWFIVSILIVPISILSSKFNTQVLLSFSIILSIYGNFYLIMSLITGMLIGYFIFGKILIDILKTHYHHSLFYYKYNQKKYLWPSQLTWSQYKNLFIRKIKDKKLMQWLYQENNIYHQLLFIYWPLIYIFYSFFFNNYSEQLNNLYMFIVAGFIITLTVSIKYFLFLGELERYLEYTVFAQAILLTIICIDNKDEWLIKLYLIQSILGYFYYLGIHSQYYKMSHQLYLEMRDIIQKIDNKDTLILPIGGLHWLILYFSKNITVITTINDNEKKFPYAKWKKILGNYPYPGDTIEEIYKDFNFNYIIIRNDRIKIYEKILNDKIFTETKLDLVRKTEILSLYKFKEKDE